MQCIVQCTVYSSHYTAVYSVHCTVQFTVQYTLQCTVYTTVYSIHCTVHCAVYSVQYSVHCTVYTALYTVHCTALYSWDTSSAGLGLHVESYTRALPRTVAGGGDWVGELESLKQLSKERSFGCNFLHSLFCSLRLSTECLGKMMSNI